jgi:gliding motility-associated-like protein
MAKRLLFLSLLLVLHRLEAQDFSNKGKEFWIPYSYHVAMANGTATSNPPYNGLTMTLYISSDITTTYNVEIYGGASIQSGTVTAGQVVSVVIPQNFFLNATGLFTGKTVRVTSDKPVVVYSYISASAVSGATVCLPTNVLGREYISMNYTQTSNERRSNSYFTIIAVEDNTVVEIVPSATTTNGWAAGSVNTMTLNKGEIYQVLGTVNATGSGGNWQGVDLTGSRIRSIASGTSGCKRIAVFSGAGKIRIGNCSGTANSSDNLYQQLYPLASWGKNFLTVPSFARPTNFYRIIKGSPSANVYLNGTLIPAASFVNGVYHEFSNNTPNAITSDQAISVAQFFTTQGCSGNATNYDPDMILLNPVEQNISKVTLVSSNLVAPSGRQHHIHVIIPKGGTGMSSFRIDGTPIPANAWVTHPSNPAFAFAYLDSVTQGYHTLSSDSGFNALAYGYAAAESYGYSAGANVKDLYQYISVETPNATVKIPTTCRNTPFFFSMTFPYKPTRLQWVFGTALNAAGIADTTLANPVPSDSTVVNGRKLYGYRLPRQYTVPTVGLYPVRLIANNPTPDGCSGEQEINFDFDVLPNPVAGLSAPNVCQGLPVNFTDTSKTSGRSLIKYLTFFGDNTSANTLNPAKTYADSGNYTVRYVVTTDVGCVSDTFSTTVRVRPTPTAAITGTDSVCLNSTPPRITFRGGPAMPPYSFTYTLNNGAAQTVTTAAAADTVSIPVPTTATGVFTYALTAVREGSPNACAANTPTTATATVTVLTKPAATISGTTAVCHNNPAQPLVTFTGTDGLPPYTFTYTLNGGTPQTITTPASATSVTLPVPTTAVGTFAYALMDVADANGAECRQTATGTATITVNPLPTASISGTDTACLNTTPPRITFTGAGATRPYTFAYAINGGPTLTVTTASAADTVSVAVPTNPRGVFTYTLLSVTDASASSCNQNQAGSATLTVLPTPAATISGTTAVCHNNPAQPLVTFTGTGGDAPYTFTYTLNGGAPQTITTQASATSVTLPVPTTAVGTFAYALVGVADANGAECRQTATGTATITVNPLPTASISGTDTACLNSTPPRITFTGAGATRPYTFAYAINGGPTLTVTTASAADTVSVAVPTNPRGVFTYTLRSVTDASASACNQNQAGSAALTVLPTPAATISGTTAVCHNNPAQPLVTFTGTGGDAPYTFTYTLNGGTPQTITTQASATSVTLPVPTTAVGTFAYALVGVADANGAQCRQTATGTATITVNPLPTASIGGATSLCRNAAAPRITFTGAGATRPYTFAYRIDNGPTLTLTTTTGDTVSVAVPTATPGTFTYTLLSVTDASSTACAQSQAGSAAVTVWPLPSAAYTSNSPVCATGTIAFTDLSTPNSASLSAWQWNFDDPASGTRNTSSLTNPTHTFDNPGNYNIALTVTNSNGCTSVNTLPTFTVNPRPKAGFVIPEVCLNDTYAQFLDSSKVAAPASITQWNWNFGDPNWNTPPPSPNTATDKDPRHSYKAVGNYDVSLIVTSNHGCHDTILQRLVVNGSFPVARFRVLNPDNLCANDSIAIVDSSTVFPGVITKVLIYWDDINNPTVVQTDDNSRLGKVYRHLYPNFQSPLAKTYRIRFRAYSGGVCLNETTQTITVNAAPKTRFNPIPDICYDAQPYQITQAAETGGVPGTFAFSGPGVSPSGLFNPAAAGEGTHTIQYKFTASTGGCADSVTQTVKVWKRAIADFRIASSPVCEKQPVTLADTSSSQEGTITRWQWTFGDGSPTDTRTSPAPFPHTFPAFGTYPVTLSVTTANGCTSAPKTLNIPVQPLARPNFSFPPVSCLPNAVIPFTNTSSVPGSDTSSLSYLWNFGDPASGPVNTSTARHPAHTYANLGPFNVNLRVTTQAGCIHDTTIALNTIHPQPIADFSISAADVCLGGQLQLDNTSNTQDGTLKTLRWDLGDGNTRNTPSLSHTYAATGLYTITLQVTNSFDCPSTIASKTVSINPNPIADAGPNRVVLEGGQITINASASNANGLQYSWTPPKGLNDPTLLKPVAFPDSSTRYLLTVTSDKGCTDTSSMFLKVLYKPVVMNTFTPNGDGVNDRWDILYIESYPGAVIEVYNTAGQLVFRTIGYNIPWDGTLNGKPLPTGTYYYVINPKNGRAKMAGYVTIIR